MSENVIPFTRSMEAQRQMALEFVMQSIEEGMLPGDRVQILDDPEDMKRLIQIPSL